MLTYDQAVKDEKAGFQKLLKRLKHHQKLFPIARKYAEKFSSNHDSISDGRRSYVFYASGSGTIQCLAISVNIGKQDTVKDILPVINEMIKDPQLETIQPLPKAIGDKWEPLDIKFQLNNSPNTAYLLVRIWIYNSTKCKLVSTGKHKEIMKVVCEE